MSIFDEHYRVIAIESNRLLVRGIRSGDVLTIINTDPETPSYARTLSAGKISCFDRPVNCAFELGLSISRALEAIRKIPLRHRGDPELFSKPSNFEHRAILRKVHHLCR